MRKVMVKVFKNYENFNTNGTSLKGYINASYDELFHILGEPTYNEPSGDNKIQIEWVVKFGNELFTVYDWKTYDREYTINELSEFNVGGKTDANEFIEYLESILSNIY